MTERIDHAAEAANFLSATVIDAYGDDDRKAAIAQVHATLALVEQQRIANLMKYAERLEDHRASRMDGSLVDEIEKAIGM